MVSGHTEPLPTGTITVKVNGMSISVPNGKFSKKFDRSFSSHFLWFSQVRQCWTPAKWPESKSRHCVIIPCSNLLAFADFASLNRSFLHFCIVRACVFFNAVLIAMQVVSPKGEIFPNAPNKLIAACATDAYDGYAFIVFSCVFRLSLCVCVWVVLFDISAVEWRY